MPLSYVDIDQEGGARLAAEHLLARGRRRLATISGPQDMPAGQDRLAGFRAALAAHGLTAAPAVEGDFTRESGENAARLLLDRHPDLDGLFVANDLMAEGAVRALQEAGRRVPEDVAVVGFDDSSAALAVPAAADHHPPAGGGDGGRDGPPAAGRAARPAPDRPLGDLPPDPGGPPVRLTRVGLFRVAYPRCLPALPTRVAYPR